MIGKIVEISLKNKYFVLFLAFALVILGVVSFKSLPIEAYPDVADTWVQVITQWPGHAAEEIETQITVPIEIEMSSVPHHTHIRSISLFGLSVVTVLFDEETATFTARMYVLEKLSQLTLPNGVSPVMGPMASPTGSVYWYYLDGGARPTMELKELQDWELEKRLREVPGIADVSSFGGEIKQFQALVDPMALANYGLSTANVVQALSNNNQNSGGGFITNGAQAFNVRGVGRADTIKDLQNVIISQKGGTPIRVGNVGEVAVGPQVRLGKIAVSERMSDGSVKNIDDAVEGIIFARKGEPDEGVLKGIVKKVDELNSKFLPPDVKIMGYLNRLDLIHLTTHTVEENMLMGMTLVFIILLFFLGNLRSALIVATTIPLSLLFASIFLDLRHIPANLLSLGALDFGMVVDGAVVMVENIFRHKQDKELQKAEAENGIVYLIAKSAREVQKPIVFSIGIIILAYLPIFTLQRVEGRLFSPMAWTVAFALLGSLVLCLTVIPVLCALFLKGEVKEWHNPYVQWIRDKYRFALVWALARRPLVMKLALGSFALTLILAFGGPIGSEFLPHLDEGSLWVRGTLPPSASLELAEETVKKARAVFMQYPEVPISVCQIGRPDDGTDATGFFNTECFVDLIPRKKWRREFKTKDALVSAMSRDLERVPGVLWNFSQPISDNLEEMMSGVKGALVVKIYGQDLKVLSEKAEEIKKAIASVRGVEDLGIFEEMGQPNVNVVINRDKISRYGLNISDVQDVIETAVGGKAASQVVDGEKRFAVVVRYQQRYRESIEALKRISVATPEGYRVPLEELADIKIEEGASLIYREKNSRYIAVKFSVRGRDLGSTVEEAQKRVKKKVLLPEGYGLAWSGEFESQKRSEARLMMIVPITVGAIFLILFLIFNSIKMASIVMCDVMFARIGGVLALFLTGTNFSVSSGIGFLAVFGVSIQTGVLLVSYINQLRVQGYAIKDAVIEGACLRLRPIMMTALVATFGLLPAAMSHAIGSDSQRPMAIVIVGGLLADLFMGFFLLPTLYLWFARPHDKLVKT